MAIYDSEIAALESAIAGGALEVESVVNGVKKRVRFSSFDDMLKRLNWFKTKQAEASQGGLPRVTVAIMGRGR